MSPANGHANDSANIPSTAVQQFAPPAGDTNIPTALSCLSDQCPTTYALLAIARDSI